MDVTNGKWEKGKSILSFFAFFANFTIFVNFANLAVFVNFAENDVLSGARASGLGGQGQGGQGRGWERVSEARVSEARVRAKASGRRDRTSKDSLFHFIILQTFFPRAIAPFAGIDPEIWWINQIMGIFFEKLTREMIGNIKTHL